MTPLPPGSTIGILGGGQLGRMLSQAASRLGFNVVILDPEENSPAGRVSQGQIVAAYDNATALGVLGVELFDLGDGRLLVNEIAPRVHNTGHWTQDGCVCDQFEQHIRAIAGWPLGPTTAHARVEMTNLLGDEIEQWKALSARPDARLHLYGKRDAKPGRKMGHVNRVKPLG